MNGMGYIKSLSAERIMRKKRLLFSVLFCMLFFYTHALYSAEEVGELYSIEGEAELHNPDGKITKLDQKKDLLHPVCEGDIIRALNGTVTVVLWENNKGYKINSNSECVVKDGKMMNIKGSVHEAEYLKSPPKELRYVSKKMGGIVIRGSKTKKVEPCLQAISPADSAVLELTPELVWDNKCPQEKKVVVSISAEGVEIFKTECAGNSLKIPANVLHYGKEYQWTVKTAAGDNKTEKTITILTEDKITSIKKKISYYAQHSNDLSMRLSKVFYLIDEELYEMGIAEVKKLNSEFPENEYIRQLIKQLE